MISDSCHEDKGKVSSWPDRGWQHGTVSENKYYSPSASFVQATYYFFKTTPRLTFKLKSLAKPRPQISHLCRLEGSSGVSPGTYPRPPPKGFLILGFPSSYKTLREMTVPSEDEDDDDKDNDTEMDF
jgi:hypothetical protein